MPMCETLLTLFNLVSNNENVPSQWMEHLIVSLLRKEIGEIRVIIEVKLRRIW